MDMIFKAARIEKAAVGERELVLINAQALRELSAEEVFTFRLAACDNQIDRDCERFTEATLEQLGAALLRERRSERRWRVFFRIAWLLLIGADDAPAGYLRQGAVDPLAIYPPAPAKVAKVSAST